MDKGTVRRGDASRVFSHPWSPACLLIFSLLLFRATNAAATWTAYNDCAWTANSGQNPSANDITGNFTTNNPMAMLSGSLIQTDGSAVPSAQMSFNTNGAACSLLDRAFGPQAGTDAAIWFVGKVGTNCAANWTGGTVTMSLTGLDPAARYNIVLWSTRGADGAAYSNRFTDITISGADLFTNKSSSGTTWFTNATPNDRTRVRAALAPGLVARYDGVNPGTDGAVTFAMTAGADALYPTNSPYGTNGYLNAVLVQEYAGAGGGASTNYVWRQGLVTGTMNATSCYLYLYTSNTIAPVYVDDLYMCLGSTAESGANRVVNPGFESGTNGWEIMGSFVGTSQPVTTHTRGGSYSLLLQASAPVAGGGSSESVKQSVTGLTSGAVHTLSFWYYATNAVDFVARYSAHPAMTVSTHLGSTGTATNGAAGGEFTMTGQWMPASNSIHLAANTASGKICRVMWRDSLFSGSWQQYALRTADVSSVSVDIPLTVSHRYYQLVETALGLPLADNASGVSAVGATTATLNGNLSSTGDLPTTVFICWDTSDKGAGATSAWAHVDSLGVKTVGAFSNSVSGLTVAATYSYRCFALNSVGGSFAPSASGFTTEPLAATGLAFSAITNLSMTVSWSTNTTAATGSLVIMQDGADPSTPPTDGTTYNGNAVYGSGVGLGSGYSVMAGAGTSVNVSGLTGGHTYYVRVYTYVGSGFSINYRQTGPATGSQLTAAPAALAAPSALNATALSTNAISLVWTDNATNETGFKVERKTGAGGSYAQIATVGANVTGYGSTGLTANTLYYFRVRANNAVGDSTYASEVSASTDPTTQFQNPGVYAEVVNGLRYEWIATRDVNFQIAADGKTRIIAPSTKSSFNGSHTCQRFIYDQTHTRLSTADSTALLGSGLMLQPGTYGFTLLWINSTNYDYVLNNGWPLTSDPNTYQDNSAKVDYIHLSIVPVTPVTPAASSVPEIAIPDDLKRVSWLPHYLLLPYDLHLPADRGFSVTRILWDIPLTGVYQKVTQINYMYGNLNSAPNSNKWEVMRAYGGDTVASLVQNSTLDKKFGYMAQLAEDFANMGDTDYTLHAQQVFQGIYQRFQNEQGVTSPNQTRLYDDYFSDGGGYSNAEFWRWVFNSTNEVSLLASQTTARQGSGSTTACGYFSAGAYDYRNWFEGGYLDSFERVPEGLRVYNEIYNYEKKAMAAPDRKVAKFGWIYAEGVDSKMYTHGCDMRLHFPGGDIIRTDFVSFSYQMMLNESFWTLLLGNDYYFWNSAVTEVSDIRAFGDSWFAGSPTTLWQPTGGSIVDYNTNDVTAPQKTSSPLGLFPEAPQLGESGAFAGAWLVSQLTTASDRISTTIEYCPFTYKINGGSSQLGYYNSSSPANGSLGNAKLSRYGVANYGQANIVKTYEAKKPICIYTQGASGGAVIYHNVYCGLTDTNDVTITTPSGAKTFQVVGNCLHVFYVN